MIFDHINNIETYKGLSPDIYEGLKFLQQITRDVAVDTYQLNPRGKAIVSEYETKLQNECGFEAHKRFIDIQYLLKGKERINFLPIEKLKKSISYSEENDAAFYLSDNKPQELEIGNGYFVIFYPQDGHMPQLCIDEPMMVKKVVAKVAI